MSISEIETLERLYIYRFFRSMIIDELSNIIAKSYLKDGYCLKIINILQNTMFEIRKTSLSDANKYFLEEMKKLKNRLKT